MVLQGISFGLIEDQVHLERHTNALLLTYFIYHYTIVFILLKKRKKIL